MSLRLLRPGFSAANAATGIFGSAFRQRCFAPCMLLVANGDVSLSDEGRDAPGKTISLDLQPAQHRHQGVARSAQRTRRVGHQLQVGQQAEWSTVMLLRLLHLGKEAKWTMVKL